jgi:hypothetical protein
VSEDGLMILADIDPGPQTKIGVRLAQSGVMERIELVGDVCWRAGKRVGLRIVAMPSKYRARYTALVALARQNASCVTPVTNEGMTIPELEIELDITNDGEVVYSAPPHNTGTDPRR